MPSAIVPLRPRTYTIPILTNPIIKHDERTTPQPPRIYRRLRPPLLAKALLVQEFGAPFVLSHWHPVPIPGPDEVRIKCVAAGLNPVDWQAKDYNFGIASLPWVSGRDLSGIVDSVGSNVQNLHPGDAVFTLTDYSYSQCGAFQEYCVAKASSVARIPHCLTFEEAAAIPVAAITAAVSLQRFMKLETVFERKGEWMLIWGGATNTGFFAVQLARNYGFRVVAVAGRGNFDYLYGAGAEVVLDRDDGPDRVIAEIKGLTEGRLRYAFDAVGSTTAEYCLRAMEGGDGAIEKVLIALAGFPNEVKQAGAVNKTMHLSDGTLVAVPEVKVKLFHKDEDYGERLLQELTGYLENGQLKVPRVVVIGSGLSAVNEGVALLKSGKVSGSKLVIRMDETADLNNKCEYMGWL